MATRRVLLLYLSRARQTVLSNLALRTHENKPERAVALVLGGTLSLQLPCTIARLRRPGARASLPDCGFLEDKQAAAETGVAVLLNLLTNKSRAAGCFPNADLGG